MPEKRQHRGPHPQDHALFAPPQWPRLRAAVMDLSWLLSRGYADAAALKLVGDHYQLTTRQRTAVRRCACSDAALAGRAGREVGHKSIRGRRLQIDGFNIITTVEAALAGGVLIGGRDRCLRDMASMHGTYRKVRETLPAAALIGRTLAALGIGEARWVLDRPVSNSGRLRVVLLELARLHGWPWEVELSDHADRTLVESGEIVASADSVILDRCAAWFNLGRAVLATCLSRVEPVELGTPDDA